jgi:hypothetical protein
MKIIRTSKYPIRYLTFENEGIIIENEKQEKRGGYELLHYYNTHNKGNISATIDSYQGEGYLVSVHAELDRENIRDRKQVGFTEIYYNYDHAKKITLNKIEFYEKWVIDRIVWRMTRKEYYEEIHPKAVKEYEKQVKQWERNREEYKAINELLNPLKNKDFIITNYENIGMQEHKRIVMEALENGGNVPKKVMDDYGFTKEEVTDVGVHPVRLLKLSEKKVEK